MRYPEIHLPQAFILNTQGRGPAEAAWLQKLPEIVAAAVERWDLQLGSHFEPLSYNYVAPARMPDGSQAVLKACFPGEDFLHEAAALRHFDGRGCASLFDADLAAGLLLLERVEPGEMVHTIGDDEAETAAAASVMRALWMAPPPAAAFPTAESWLRAALHPAAMPQTKRSHPWIDTALAIGADLADTPEPTLLLHGDLHHDNILSARRSPWLAIDPHGVIGEAAWEIAPFLFNHLEVFDRSDWPTVIRRRADQFADELGLDRQRLYAWSTVRAVQSAFWSLRDGEEQADINFQGALVCAQTLLHHAGT